MKILITLELPKKLHEQLEAAAAEQPHLDGIEELAIACLEDAMEEREEYVQSYRSHEPEKPRNPDDTSFGHLVFPE